MKCGDYKSCSEDTVLVDGKLLKDGYHTSNRTGDCIGLADGVGGNAGGKEASEYVLYHCMNRYIDGSMSSAMHLNDDLIKYAKTIPGKERMATTMSVILFSPDRGAKIIHVGNTRIYAIQGKYLKQLTKDHTTTEMLKSRGEFEAAELAPKNEITACFGSGDSTLINQLQIFNIEKEYSGYVLTSDGFHDHLDEEDIEDFCSQGDYSFQAFEDLAEAAREKGSVDDKSIIIIRFDNEDN